jgi:hypothetical protein
MRIRMVGADELGVLQDIERAAGWCFREGDARDRRGRAVAEVPWNAPYHRRCGFWVLGEGELTPSLRAIREREIAHGLDRWPRVCMRRDL